MSLELPSLLVLYCYVTNCHTFRSLKKHSSTYSQFHRSDSQVDSVKSLLRVWQGPGQCGSGRGPGEKFTSKHSSCWLNSDPWSCRSEILTSLLALRWGQVLAPQSCHYFSHGCFIFTSSRSTPSPSHTSDLPDFSFCCQPEKIPTWKRLRIIHPDNFPILRSID